MFRYGLSISRYIDLCKSFEDYDGNRNEETRLEYVIGVTVDVEDNEGESIYKDSHRLGWM